MCVTSLITGVCSCCSEAPAESCPDAGELVDAPVESCCHTEPDDSTDEQLRSGAEHACACDISIPDDSRRVDASRLADIEILPAPVLASLGPAVFYAADATQPTVSVGLRAPPTSPTLTLLCVMIC